MKDIFYYSGVVFWLFVFVIIVLFLFKITPNRFQVFITNCITIFHPIFIKDTHKKHKLKLVENCIENSKHPEQKIFAKWWRFWLKRKSK